MSKFFDIDNKMSPPDSAVKTDALAGLTSVSAGEFDFVLGVSYLNNEVGRDVTLVVDSSTLCKGVVGTTGKFCSRDSSSCPIQTHTRKKAVVFPGLYIQSGTTDLLEEPFLPREKLPDGLIPEFLEKNFPDTTEIVRYFDMLKNSSENERKESLFRFTSLEARNSEVKSLLAAKTPGRKRKVEDLSDEYQEIVEQLTDLVSEEDMSKDVVKLVDKVKLLLEFFLNAINEGQTSAQMAGIKVDDVILQLGVWSNGDSHVAPATLWGAIGQILDDLKRLEEMQEKLETSTSGINLISAMGEDDLTRLTGQIKNTTIQLESEISALQRRSIHAIQALEFDISNLQGRNYSTGLPYSDISTMSSALLEAATKLTTLENKIGEVADDLKNAKVGKRNGGRSGSQSVSIGRHSFDSVPELSAWCDVTFPGIIPFGAFVDPYSVLQRVRSFKDVAGDSELKDMEVRRKLHLSADEGFALESFKHPLPKIFHGGASENACNYTWLPGLSSKEKWEDESGLTGARITISSSREVIRSGVESIIEIRMQGLHEAQALARHLLSDSLSFIESLSTFICDTYRRLDHSGFGKTSSWELVSKLVHRIFAKDCHAVRGRVAEHMDASEAKSMAVGVLWATLATHQVMREYMEHGIENHPSISSEYVRFLVAHSGLTRLDKLERRMLTLEKDNDDLKKQIVNAVKAATTASNKAEQALKEAKNRN